MNSFIILLFLVSFSSQRHTHHLITDLTLQSFSEGIVDAKNRIPIASNNRFISRSSISASSYETKHSYLRHLDL